MAARAALTAQIQKVTAGSNEKFAATADSNGVLTLTGDQGTVIRIDKNLSGTESIYADNSTTTTAFDSAGLLTQYDNVSLDVGGNISEQMAFFNSTQNLTQVQNFTNGVSIGSGIIEGQASTAQLAQENSLAFAAAPATSLTDLVTNNAIATFGIQSNAQTSAAISAADQGLSSTGPSSPVSFSADTNYTKFLTAQASGDNLYNQSSTRTKSTVTDLLADPTALALEDGVLAVKMAQQNPSVLSVLIALQKVLLAGGVLSSDLKNKTATQLNTTPDAVNKLIIQGGAALTSIIAAYQNPTPVSVANAAIQLLQVGIPFTDDLKRATSQALGLGTTDLTAMNNLLLYGGAGLSAVSALQNPTPQNIVQAGQVVTSTVSRITSDAALAQKYTDLSNALANINVGLNLLDFAKNPNPNTALSAALSIGTKLELIPTPFTAGLVVAQLVLPGPTQDAINGVYNAASSIVQGVGSAVQSIGNVVSSVVQGAGNVISSILGGLGDLFGPLAFNLTGGAVYSTGLAAGSPLFDVNGDGTRVRTGWLGANEGFLVRDLKGNGQIDSVRQMFSEKNSPTGQSAFAQLAGLDSDQDGKIDKNERTWGDLKIWVNKKGDGVCHADELYTLAQLGIASIDLHTTHGFKYDNGNVIGDTSTFTYTDGSKGQVADAIFATQSASATANPNNLIVMGNNSTTVRLSNGKTAQVLNGGGQTVDASRIGVNVVISQGGGNTLTAGNSNGAVLVGGKGDVLNTGNASGVTLVGNGGASLNGNGRNTSFIANGSGNIVTAGNGSDTTYWWGNHSIQVNGDGNTVNASVDDATISATGNSNSFTLGNYGTLTVTGNSNNLSGGNYSQVAVTGNKNNVTVGYGSQANLTGNVNTLAVGDNAIVGVTGNSNGLKAGANNSLYVSGDNNGVRATGAGNSLFIAGQRGNVSLSKGTVAVGDGSSISLLGSANKITAGSKDTLAVRGNLNSITATGLGDNLTVNGGGNNASLSNGSVTVGDYSRLNLQGDKNAISVGISDTLAVIGNSNAITAKKETVSVRGSSSVKDITGALDLIGIRGKDNTVSGVAASQVKAMTASQSFITLAASQAGNLVSAMASFAPPASGPITVLASAQQPRTVMIAAAR